MDVIEINGLRIRTEVRFSPHELGKLQELNITIHLRTCVKKAGETDLVEDTINYKNIAKDVLFHVENKKYNLIEAVTTDVARICVVRYGVPSVKVIVEKPNALRFAGSSSVTIERCWEDMEWHEAHVKLGSNVDPTRKIPQAIRLLMDKGIVIIGLSSAFWTKAMMVEEKADDFINISALVKTKLDVEGLKLVLFDIERQMQRERNPSQSSFTIDLDIAFFGDRITEYVLNRSPIGKRQVVPHPETLKEAHVIIPLADLTPNFVHPQEKKCLRDMAREISGKDDFCSQFSTVQDKGFLEMIDGLVEQSHRLADSCKMKPRFKGECQIFDGELLMNENTPETGKSPNDSNPNTDILRDLIKPSTDTSLDNASDFQNSRCSTDTILSDSKDRFKATIPICIEQPLAIEIRPVALVTGAARRIGASIIRKLHAEGYNVVIHYNKSKTEANKLIKELNRERNNSAELVQADLSRDVSKTAQRIITEAVEVWGRLDVLVNNASQFLPTHIDAVTEQDWTVLMHANLTSPFFLSQAAVPFLRAYSRGSIVNLCDIHGVRPKSDYSVYCISKAGLYMATLSLAKEFAPNIRVNGVAPGCILWAEKSWDGMSVEERELKKTERAKKHQETLSKVPFGRSGDPADIADTVLFLCSSAEYTSYSTAGFWQGV